MMSRMMDPRKIFILGIAMIFGLSVTALLDAYSQIGIVWLRPIFGSSLYLSTLLAVGLTILFQIGLKRKTSRDVEPGKTTYDDIADLLEKQGALWGARPAVIAQATRALNELLELLAALNLAEKPVRLELMFDEFNLDLTLEYDGKPLALAGDYAAPLSVDADVSLEQLALRLIRKDADVLSVAEKDGRSRIILHFEH
jgi:NCS2 family nucleobase:cation symporter-2